MAKRKQSPNLALSPWTIAGFVFIWITALQVYPYLTVFQSLPWLLADLIFALIVGFANLLWAYLVQQFTQP